jgi:hypothetical protein
VGRYERRLKAARAGHVSYDLVDSSTYLVLRNHLAMFLGVITGKLDDTTTKWHHPACQFALPG